MSGERDKVLVRIKKLLQMGEYEGAGVANPAEAELALARAYALMADHAVSREEVDQVELGTQKWVRRVVLESRSRPLEIVAVMGIISQHFPVEIFESVTEATSDFTYARAYTMYGTESNVDIAEQIFHYLRRTLRQLWKEYRKQEIAEGALPWALDRREMRAYYLGIRAGLARRLRQEGERLAEEQQTALVLVKEETTKRFEKEFPHMDHMKTSAVGSSLSWSRGYDDSKRVSLVPGLSRSNKKELGS